MFTVDEGRFSLSVEIAVSPPKVIADKSLLLWVDTEQNDPKAISEIRQNHPVLQIEFMPMISQARTYIGKNLELIRAQARFLVICRGYYAQESKTGTDVANLLNEFNIQTVCLVYTGDRTAFLARVTDPPESMQVFDQRDNLLKFVHDFME